MALLFRNFLFPFSFFLFNFFKLDFLIYAHFLSLNYRDKLMLTRSDKVGEAEIEYKEVSHLRRVFLLHALVSHVLRLKWCFDAVEGRE